MNAYLLYSDREWSKGKPYYDARSIIQDLNLEVLFKAAARNQEEQRGNVQVLGAFDHYLAEVMEKVMMVPLRSREEIEYRQEIVRDCLAMDGFAEGLYRFSDQVILEWNQLGGRSLKKDYRESNGYLIARIKMVHLFLDQLAQLKQFLQQYRTQMKSRGLQTLLARLEREFGTEDEAFLRQLMESIGFYCDGKKLSEVQNEALKPVLRLECSLSGGMKLDEIRLDEVRTTDKKNKKEKRQKPLAEKWLGAFTLEPAIALKEDTLLKDFKQLEYAVVRYVMDYLEPFYLGMQEFFEQLHVQSAFYLGACRMYQRLKKVGTKTTTEEASQNDEGLAICFPVVGGGQDLTFSDLKECSMMLARRIDAVGNDAAILDKRLLVVTGANQGGKSTFLRSIGIAQIMMQCGLFVSARQYESGIFPGLYTHFTRHEDVQMNSGRLDEELGRMERMILHLEPDSMMLLNESFATTTEQEGSEIAYDIVMALVESGVKVLMVTHLLSFAKRCYQKEMKEAEYLAAQRLEDGTRTYRMVQGKPELTSFGLDLYEEIIEAET